jgi:hypothetical protein
MIAMKPEFYRQRIVLLISALFLLFPIIIMAGNDPAANMIKNGDFHRGKNTGKSVLEVG